MFMTRFCAAALLALFIGAGAIAAEATPPTTPPQNPTPPTIDPQASAAELMKQLPQVPNIIEHDGVVMWQDGEKASFKIVAVTQDKDSNPVLETAIGKLPVLRKLVADARAGLAALDALPNLVDKAKAADLKGETLLLREGLLTGIHLFSPEVVVIADGVLKRAVVAAPNRAEDKQRIVSGVERLSAALAKTDLDDLGKKTLDDVLRRLSQDDPKDEAPDDLAPSLARRVVRFGWLRQFYKNDTEPVTAIEQQVTKAEKYQPVTLFEGPGLRLAEVKDAFGRGGWILTTPTRSAYIQPHEEPLYYWAWPKPMVVVDLPPGADPTVVNQQPLGARIFAEVQELATWNKDKGLVVNKEEWRKAIPASGHKGIEANATADFMPPHILVTGLNGDIVKLITANGVLTPPANGSATEAERFLAEAAKTLPDPAHLDLIGEYILQYVYDSPDSRYPYLIGNKQVKGDIHQTALQTIATTCGGMFRGDCDDLSELYQTIAERQGRTAHVISLPQHAAMAFAEKKEDGNWHAYVLQTGPPLEFTDAKLPMALEKAYKSFNENETFDPNGLGLLLRFSGENTRGSWRLSWRIFSEPEYAKTMIDVQRDWQYQTYQRGINKMLKLIEGGDRDNANYRELSGLYSFTGQYPLAVQYHEDAISKTESPENRLDLSVELVMHLFDAKQTDRARALALDVLDKQLPALKKNPELKEKVEATQAQLGIELASTLCRGKAYDLALRTLKETQLDDMAGKIEQVGQWLASPRYNQRVWENSPQLMALRRGMEMYVAVAIELLKGMSPDALQKNADLQTVARSVQEWLTHVAFHDVDEPEDALARYATAGRYYAAMLGEERLQTLLDAAELPKKGEADHTKRIGGLAQLQLDLPWIKLSVPFWSGRLLELFEKERATLDKPLATHLGKQVAESYEASKRLGLEHPSFEMQSHLAAVVTALIAQDAKTLRERLHFVKQKDDKRLRDDTAQWLGDPARFVPLDWYAQVLQIWKEELNYKPKYYWIAWRAALNGAPKHALLVAELAAEQFKDDPSFTEERDFMKKLFDQSGRNADRGGDKAGKLEAPKPVQAVGAGK